MSGVWKDCHLEEHINLLEMRAVILLLGHFQEVIQGQCLLIATDNTTVVAYIHNQGVLTPFLCIFYAETCCCYASLQTVLTVRHVPGNHNLIVDALSRFRVQ